MVRTQVLIPLERNPFEVFMLALFGFSGFVGLFAGSDNPGVPRWVDISWYGLLALGAVIGLAGEFWRDAVTGLLLLRAAMIPIGVGAYLYAIPVGADAGALPAMITVGLGFAAHWKCYQITRLIRHRESV